MTNEQLRMQMLSGIITEGEYKAKLEENTFLNEDKDVKKLLKHLEERNKTLETARKKAEDKIANEKKKENPNKDKIETYLEDVEFSKDEIKKNNLAIKSLKKDHKDSLNESMIGGIVGVGAITQIPSRAKTDYEMAFEHFLGEKYEVKPNRERDDIKDINEEKELTYNDFIQMVRDDMMAGASPDERPSDERVKKDAKWKYNEYLQGTSVDDLFESEQDLEEDDSANDMDQKLSDLEEGNPLIGGAGFMSKKEIFKLTKLIAGAELELAGQGDSMTPESIAKAEETISGLRAARERAVEKYKAELKDNYSGMRENEESDNY